MFGLLTDRRWSPPRVQVPKNVPSWTIDVEGALRPMTHGVKMRFGYPMVWSECMCVRKAADRSI